MNHQLSCVALLTLFFIISISSPAFAANECKIEYSWNTGNSMQGTFKNHKNSIYINRGQTKVINKSRMNYVINLKTNDVKFFLTNASDITLGKNLRNPVIANYIGNVKLKKAKCLTPSSSSSNNSPATPQALIQTLNSQGINVKEIVKQLKNTFNKNASQICVLLDGSGFNTDQIVSGVKGNFTSPNVMQLLFYVFRKSINNTNEDKAYFYKTIKKYYKVGNTQIAKTSRAAKYTADEVAKTLKAAFKMNRKKIEQALQVAGYTSAQINTALNKVSGVAVKSKGIKRNSHKSAK
jgi:hypothetical protein